MVYHLCCFDGSLIWRISIYSLMGQPRVASNYSSRLSTISSRSYYMLSCTLGNFLSYQICVFYHNIDMFSVPSALSNPSFAFFLCHLLHQFGSCRLLCSYKSSQFLLLLAWGCVVDLLLVRIYSNSIGFFYCFCYPFAVFLNCLNDLFQNSIFSVISELAGFSLFLESQSAFMFPYFPVLFYWTNN